jgi:hypothetical protein
MRKAYHGEDEHDAASSAAPQHCQIQGVVAHFQHIVRSPPLQMSGHIVGREDRTQWRDGGRSEVVDTAVSWRHPHGSLPIVCVPTMAV